MNSTFASHAQPSNDRTASKRRLLRHAAIVASLVGLLGLAACTTTVTTGATGGGCNPDGNVACSSGTGYSCSGASQPEDTDGNLVCSADQGTGEFCCVADSACSYSASVSCVGGAIGYSCSGATPPDSADPSLICSEPNSNNDYCCFTQAFASGVSSSGVTCAQDQTVAGCQDGSYGFSCTGSDTPDQDFVNITCSTGTPGTNATLFCCAY